MDPPPIEDYRARELEILGTLDPGAPTFPTKRSDLRALAALATLYEDRAAAEWDRVDLTAPREALLDDRAGLLGVVPDCEGARAAWTLITEACDRRALGARACRRARAGVARLGEPPPVEVARAWLEMAAQGDGAPMGLCGPTATSQLQRDRTRPTADLATALTRAGSAAETCPAARRDPARRDSARQRPVRGAR